MEIDFQFTPIVKGSANIERFDSLNIDFSNTIFKRMSIFKIEFDTKCKVNITVDRYYNIDTLEFYDEHSSKEVKLFDKVHFDLLQEHEWDLSQIVYDICSNIATQKTRIAVDEFNYVFTFDDIEEMISFIRYYDKVEDNYNILENYYHLIFIKKRDYKRYLNTKHWKEKRKQILKRANYKCQLCSSKDKLHVHHNTYENIGNEKKEDLVVLCEKCHSKFHDK